MKISTYGYSVNSAVPTAQCTFGKTVRIKQVKLLAGSGGGLAMNVYYVDTKGAKQKIMSAVKLSASGNKTWTSSSYVEATGLYVECSTQQEQYLAGIGVTQWYEK